MSFWSIIEAILDWEHWLSHWRWHLSFWGGLALAVVVGSSMPYRPLGYAAGAAVLVFCVITGWRWDNKA